MWWFVVVCVVARVAGDVVSPWWNNAVYYRILVDSFRDSDGDGLGDIRGVLKQISYVRALGADAVILSPISVRSTDCSKPGAIDLIEIDQRYGDKASFKELLEKAKSLDLKVVITLPMTVSSKSELVTMSANHATGFEDAVVWKDGNFDELPPPEHGVDEWRWHAIRNAYWGSAHDETLLNFCSNGIIAALSAAQCAWLKRGVSGILLKPDFPKDQKCGEQLLKRLAADAMSCARSNSLNTPVILVETSLRPEQAAMYYGDTGVGANSILSKALSSSRRSTPEIVLGFHASLLTAPQDFNPTWQTSNTNESRIATRFGSDMVDAVNLLALNLPGSAVIQQGDELAAADTILEWATGGTCWPNVDSPAAAPFPWDDSQTAGFTTGQPWLPLAPNYRYANAKAEFADDFSHLGVLRIAAALRKSPAFGPHVEIKRLNGAVALLRWGTAGSLLIISNLAQEPTEVQPSMIPGIPAEMTVATTSTGSSFTIATHLVMEKTMKLKPGETLLLAGGPRHCGGPGPVDKIATKLSEGWQKINKYFSSL